MTRLTAAQWIDVLTPSRASVLPDDPMPEGGRKALLGELIEMLEHEEGSRSGIDVEQVHDMRVAIRRMRSTLRLLRAYFRKSAVRPFNNELRRLAGALGAVRDLDVLLENLRTYQAGLEPDEQAVMQGTLNACERERGQARAILLETLDSRAYRRFLKEFTDFLTTPGAGVRPLDEGAVVPVQIRHVLPAMIYARLGAVLAYDAVLPDVEAATLHALRIEFKRLRYAVSLFDMVLGPSLEKFVNELKVIQDCLGHMNDAVTANLLIGRLVDQPYSQPVRDYLTQLERHDEALRGQFTLLWRHFKSQKVQQKLSTAVLALR